MLDIQIKFQNCHCSHQAPNEICFLQSDLKIVPSRYNQNSSIDKRFFDMQSHHTISFKPKHILCSAKLGNVCNIKVFRGSILNEFFPFS